MQLCLKYKFFLLSFFLLGFVIYFPILFNGFVWDDIFYIVNNTQIHQFNSSVLFDNFFNSHFMYRQLSPVYFSLLYTFFGDNSLPYHLLQLLLHITCTMLLFFLFIKYFTPIISFILCLFFLIHPINAETVVWISSTQTIQYTIFGLLALLIIHKKNTTSKHLLLVSLLLFFSLITYEIGVFYSFLVCLYVWIQKRKQFLTMILLLSITAGLYIFLRYIGNSLDLHPNNHIILEMTNTQRLFTMPSVVLYYFKTLIFPIDLMIWQSWYTASFTFQQVLFPAFLLQLIIVLFIWYGFHIKKDKNTFTFFSFWFLIGFLPLLHIYPLDMTVADRWFYFPFIGLLGIGGYIIDENKRFLTQHKRILIILLTIILVLLSARTFVRTFDWKDNLTLFSRDIIKQPDNNSLNYNLAGQYILLKQYKEALPYLKHIEDDQLHFQTTIVELGEIYEYLGDYPQAISYYEKALEDNLIPPTVDRFAVMKGYIILLMKTKQYSKVIAILQDEMIAHSSNPSLLLYYRAEAYFQLKKYPEAYADAESLYKKYNDTQIADLYMKITKAMKTTQ